jgi:hypothetical protein
VSDRDDEFARLSRAFAVRTQTSAPDECPAAESLFEAASGDGSRADREKLLDHVARCAECTEAWRIAIEAGARPGSTHRVGSAPARRLPARAAALAASVLLAAGIGTWFALPGGQQAPGYRDSVDPLAPVARTSGSLSRDAFSLEWSPGPPDSTYSVRLTTADLTVLLERHGVAGSTLLVPPSVLAATKSGERLLWQVEIHLPDGRRIPSETQVLTLR